MEDIKLIIAHNLVELRKKHGMTQLGLAERLNYSDKAVSKWERGESMPDITVLKTIADLFDVTVDYLISVEHKEPEVPTSVSDAPRRPMSKKSLRNRAFITGMSILLVWLIATLLFVILDMALDSTYGPLIPFLYAVPVSMIVWLVMNSIWFNRRRNFLIISLLMWSLLAAIYVCTLLGGGNLWLLLVLGVPGQAIILLWSGIRRHTKSAVKGSEPDANMPSTTETAAKDDTVSP